METKGNHRKSPGEVRPDTVLEQPALPNKHQDGNR